MQQAYADVAKLLKQLKPHLIDSGIKETRLKMPGGAIQIIKIKKYLAIFDFINALLNGPEWAAVQKAFKLVTPERWKNYKLMSITGLREQEILLEAQKDLRAAWDGKKNYGKRPAFPFNRIIKIKNPGDSEESNL